MTAPQQLFTGRTPPYLHTDELADLLNTTGGGGAAWDSRRVRRWLRRCGAAIELRSEGKTRGMVVTTRERLRGVFPEAYEAILRSAPDGPGDLGDGELDPG